MVVSLESRNLYMCVGAALMVTFRKVSAILSNIYVYCRALQGPSLHFLKTGSSREFINIILAIVISCVGSRGTLMDLSSSLVLCRTLEHLDVCQSYCPVGCAVTLDLRFHALFIGHTSFCLHELMLQGGKTHYCAGSSCSSVFLIAKCRSCTTTQNSGLFLVQWLFLSDYRSDRMILLASQGHVVYRLGDDS